MHKCSNFPLSGPAATIEHVKYYSNNVVLKNHAKNKQRLFWVSPSDEAVALRHCISTQVANDALNHIPCEVYPEED